MDNNAKLRPLFIAKILYERTDEEHFLSTAQLITILEEEYGISAHRQTIKADIELLRQFGLEIEEVKSTQNRCNMFARTFDTPELVLLIDAVESSKFITPSKSKELVEKLSSLTSNHIATTLKRNVSCEGRIKSANERAYIIVDTINEAINKNKTKYDKLCEEIADKPLLSLHETFKDCCNLVETPLIPNTVNDMRSSYCGCTSLRFAHLSNSVLDISNCFQDCSSLEVAPELPQSLRSMNSAFMNCCKLSQSPDFSASREIIFMENSFENCVELKQGPNLSRCHYLKTIKNAFKGCINLENIAALPQNIENACGTFEGCTSLTVKPLMPPSAQIDANTYKGCNNII